MLLEKRLEIQSCFFARLVDGDHLALIHRCRALQRESYCAFARPIAMPVTYEGRARVILDPSIDVELKPRYYPSTMPLRGRRQ